MTADEFYIKNISFLDGGRWVMQFAEGDCKIRIEVHDDAVQESVEDNFPYISDTIGKKLEQYAQNKLDDEIIDEIEYEQFVDLLRRILP